MTRAPAAIHVGVPGQWSPSGDLRFDAVTDLGADERRWEDEGGALAIRHARSRPASRRGRAGP